MNSPSVPLSLRKVSPMTFGRENLLGTIEMLIDPLVLIATLWGLAARSMEGITPQILLLSVILFSLTFPGRAYTQRSLRLTIGSIIGNWCLIALLLGFFGYASRYLDSFDRDVLVNWLWLAPLGLIAAHLTLRSCAVSIIQAQGGEARVVVVGVNSLGLQLADTIRQNSLLGMKVVGFFDDRSLDRLKKPDDCHLLGGLSALPAFIKNNDIRIIYLSLPMVTQQRILDLLDNLRDTTASIYFVPDIFVTDLIQGRLDTVGRIPVVAVCETPFAGLNGVIKRISDIFISLLIVALISPLLVAIAIGVKTGSPGPIIFRQRRYGLDGKEIVVYKFRSMTVCEDGPTIRQASKTDQRITPFGAFLRKTSLDELPQFFNVLQGRMSIVGPRPHAVAHNEEYRGLIKGYMVRHKVKPGITGWAQINGYRGETDTLEKMRKRIEYDLDYLRHWSMRLDILIIIKTVLVVFRDRNAY